MINFKETKKLLELTIDSFIEELANLEQAEYIINEVIPNSYSRTKIIGKNYMMECPDCGWWGSSEYVGGGGQIADTGGYGDCYCPICCSIDVSKKI